LILIQSFLSIFAIQNPEQHTVQIRDDHTAHLLLTR
jgi:hypothetical protein